MQNKNFPFARKSCKNSALKFSIEKSISFVSYYILFMVVAQSFLVLVVIA